VAEYIREPKKGGGAALDERQDEKLARPRRFKVILHNDHYTTMEFVIFVLQEVFRKNYSEAEQIMLNVHKNGMGIAGVYIKGIAEKKADTVLKLAREHGHPLRCTVQPE